MYRYEKWEKTLNPLLVAPAVKIINSKKEDVPPMISNLSTVYERSMDAAMEKGKAENLINMIRKMYQNGIELHQIAKIAEIPEENVKKHLGID